MARNLDLTALRAFSVTADMGSVTRAASFLNLTQSAVSMQIKLISPPAAGSRTLMPLPASSMPRRSPTG